MKKVKFYTRHWFFGITLFWYRFGAKLVISIPFIGILGGDSCTVCSSLTSSCTILGLSGLCSITTLGTRVFEHSILLDVSGVGCLGNGLLFLMTFVIFDTSFGFFNWCSLTGSFCTLAKSRFLWRIVESNFARSWSALKKLNNWKSLLLYTK